MEIKLLESLIIPFLKFITKFKFKEHVISVFDVIVEARTILIIMPDKLNDFGIARNYLNVIHDNFPKAKLTIVMRDLYRNLIDESKNYGTIFVTSKDKSLLGLPKKEFINDVAIIAYDIAIDLNHSFHLFSTYLCHKSGAKLRICLENKERDPFYNFSFRSPVIENLDNKYRNLFRYLNAKANDLVKNY